MMLCTRAMTRLFYERRLDAVVKCIKKKEKLKNSIQTLTDYPRDSGIDFGLKNDNIARVGFELKKVRSRRIPIVIG